MPLTGRPCREKISKTKQICQGVHNVLTSVPFAEENTRKRDLFQSTTEQLELKSLCSKCESWSWEEWFEKIITFMEDL